jgi:hypothetical protein
MGAVNTTYTFTATDTITSTKMNNIIDETVMTGDAVLGGSGGSGGLDIASGKLSISANAINSSRLAAGSVSNTNVSDTAAIVGTKISPNFGTQNIVTTGSIDVGASSLGSTFLKRTDTTNEGGDLTFAKAIDNTSGFVIDCYGSTSSPDLRFISGSSIAATLTTSGNVGIGTSNPSTILDVNGTVTATAFSGPLTGNVTGNVTGNAGTVTNGVYTTGTQTIGGAKTFSSAIFLSNDGFRFSSDGLQDTGMSWSSDGVINVICNGQVPGQFNTSGWTGNSATATRASNGPQNGTFTQNHNANADKIYVGGFGPSGGTKGLGMVFQRDANEDARAVEFRNQSGTVIGSIQLPQTGSIVYATTSDYRLKEDPVTISNALSKVVSLKPTNFKWINSNLREDGFIAHELREVVPTSVFGDKDAVDTDGNPIYQQIDQSKLIPILVGAIQELSQKVAALEER